VADYVAKISVHHLGRRFESLLMHHQTSRSCASQDLRRKSRQKAAHL